MSWTWDPDKNETNLRKHRLSFDTAVLVFDDPLALSAPDPYPLEEHWRTIGGVGGRFLTVAHTAPEDEGQEHARPGRITSARKATRAERRAYEEGNR